MHSTAADPFEYSNFHGESIFYSLALKQDANQNDLLNLRSVFISEQAVSSVFSVSNFPIQIIGHGMHGGHGENQSVFHWLCPQRITASLANWQLLPDLKASIRVARDGICKLTLSNLS